MYKVIVFINLKICTYNLSLSDIAGGITSLRAGDKIYVTVSGIDLDQLRDSSSYLGLVMLTHKAS